jgi:flagellin
MAQIVSNQGSISAYKNYSRSDSALSAATSRLSSGVRIQRAADDPAGLAISETFRLQLRGVGAAEGNIDNALNFLNTADSWLQNVSDILGRMEELAVQYGDATKSDPENSGDSGDLANINIEFRQLVAELNAIVGTGETGAANNARAKYNGAAIFTEAQRDFQVGPDAGQIFQTIEGQLDLLSSDQFENLQELLNFDAESYVIEPGEADDTTSGTLFTVQESNAEVSSFRSLLGAVQSQLQFIKTGLAGYSENLSAAENRIRNVDLAQEISNYTRQQILTQAGLAMIAQANTQPQNVIQLLGQKTQA